MNCSRHTHQDLVKVIRGVHEKLRESNYLTEDLNKVWSDHIADQDLRKKYAFAMFKLATEVWCGKETRLEWTHETCLDYFHKGGIERSLLRDLKISLNWFPITPEEHRYLFYRVRTENNYNTISDRKLKLLDVGSCYNPFSKFPIFSCVAIDLTPACEDVFQCDFLDVKPLKVAELNEPSEKELVLREESFDVVVFSLVLEYLPSKKQRLEFCLKASTLLQKNGLLIIISPDSKSLQRSVSMVKSWKLGLEKLGFKRIRYSKLTHLHCMAFRKAASFVEPVEEPISDLLFISQDFKKYISKENRSDSEDASIAEQFSQLPMDHPD